MGKYVDDNWTIQDSNYLWPMSCKRIGKHSLLHWYLYHGFLGHIKYPGAILFVILSPNLVAFVIFFCKNSRSMYYILIQGVNYHRKCNFNDFQWFSVISVVVVFGIFSPVILKHQLLSQRTTNLIENHWKH